MKSNTNKLGKGLLYENPISKSWTYGGKKKKKKTKMKYAIVDVSLVSLQTTEGKRTSCIGKRLAPADLILSCS